MVRRNAVLAAARVVAALTCALGVALGAARAVADDGPLDSWGTESDETWTRRTLLLSHTNDWLGPPGSRYRDDDGFTAGGSIAAELRDGDRGMLRVGLRLQMITERHGFDRVDDGKLYASWERFLGPSPEEGLTVGWTIGLRAIGDLGGSSVQNWWHHNLFAGRYIEWRGRRRLQYHYASGYYVLGELGGLVKMVHPLGERFSFREGVEAVADVGNGYFGELHPFVAIAYATRSFEIELREAAGIYGTNIQRLTMRGGYATGTPESQPALHAEWRPPRWLPGTLGFDLEWNEGGSHQHVGEITLGMRF